jgi:hypothetical protein
MANDWPRCAPATSNGSISSPSMRHSPQDGGRGRAPGAGGARSETQFTSVGVVMAAKRSRVRH